MFSVDQNLENCFVGWFCLGVFYEFALRSEGVLVIWKFDGGLRIHYKHG